jgi:hypothetical protein
MIGMVKNIKVNILQNPLNKSLFYIEIVNTKIGNNPHYNGSIGFNFTISTDNTNVVYRYNCKFKEYILYNIKKLSKNQIVPRMQTKSVAQYIYIKIIQCNGI